MYEFILVGATSCNTPWLLTALGLGVLPVWLGGPCMMGIQWCLLLEKHAFCLLNSLPGLSVFFYAHSPALGCRSVVENPESEVGVRDSSQRVALRESIADREKLQQTSSPATGCTVKLWIRDCQGQSLPLRLLDESQD